MLVRRIVVTLSYAKNGVEKDLHSVKWQRLSQSATNRSSLTFSLSPTICEGISIRALFALPHPCAPSPSTKSTRPFYERTFSVSTFSPEGRPAILCYQQHASVHQRSLGHVNCSDIKLTSRKMKEWEPMVSSTSNLILRTIEAWITRKPLYDYSFFRSLPFHCGNLFASINKLASSRIICRVCEWILWICIELFNYILYMFICYGTMADNFFLFLLDGEYYILYKIYLDTNTVCMNKF